MANHPSFFSVGEQFLVRLDADDPLPRILRVRKIINGAADAEIYCRPVLHQDADGKLHEPSRVVRQWESVLVFRVEKGEAVAPCLATGTRCIEQSGASYHKCGSGATVHAERAGEPLCGAKIRRAVEKPRRWCEWRKKSLPPRTEQSVWVPTFRAVTCKRCLSKLKPKPGRDTQAAEKE